MGRGQPSPDLGAGALELLPAAVRADPPGADVRREPLHAAGDHGAWRTTRRSWRGEGLGCRRGRGEGGGGVTWLGGGAGVEVLVTYDVKTETRAGQRRLRRVAEVCLGHGQRAQKSVFECRVTEAQLEELEDRLRR